MPRRILILNERDLENPLAGGAEVHLFETFGRLARRGHHVTLLCATFENCASRTTIQGIDVRRLTNRYAFYGAVPFAARRAARAGQGYDVVVDILCKLPFLSPWFVPLPCVAVVHHLFGTTAFAQVPFPIAAATWASEKLIPRCYRKSLYIAVSPSTKQDLVGRGVDAEQIVVVPNGLDHDLYSAGEGAKSPTPLIAWLGRAEPYKRVDVLLEAVARIAPGFPGLRLSVVGEGGAVASLRAKAAALGISDAVDFAGFVSGEVKVEILRRAHVMANPSEKEGWGLTVLEGNACGVPTVATNVPGLRDSVRHQDTGLLVPYGDVGALADALSAILNDEQLRERLTRGALAWAGRFTWDAAADETEWMLDAIIEGADPRTLRPRRSPFAA